MLATLETFELAEDIEQAADLIETHGWFKVVDGVGAVRTPRTLDGNCFCVLTAIPMRGMDNTARHLANYLGFNLNDSLEMSHSEFIVYWNDSQDSAEVVIRVLRECAQAIRERQPVDER